MGLFLNPSIVGIRCYTETGIDTETDIMDNGATITVLGLPPVFEIKNEMYKNAKHNVFYREWEQDNTIEYTWGIYKYSDEKFLLKKERMNATPISTFTSVALPTWNLTQIMKEKIQELYNELDQTQQYTFTVDCDMSCTYELNCEGHPGLTKYDQIEHLLNGAKM